MLQTPKIDPGFFIRPFTEMSWLVIFIFFFFLFFLSLVIQFFDKKASKSIIELTAWFLFVMLYAYYGGAMTMFFAVEPSLPFKTIDEAMLANPPWKVLILNGSEIFVKSRENYQHYIKGIENPDDLTVQSIDEGKNKAYTGLANKCHPS